MYNNLSNWIEISNINFAIALKEKYPGYDLIFSNTADILCPFSPDILNTIGE